MSTKIKRNNDTSSSMSLQFPYLETGQQTLVNGGKSFSLKEKEPVAGAGCLETSLYNKLQIWDEKFI